MIEQPSSPAGEPLPLSPEIAPAEGTDDAAALRTPDCKVFCLANFLWVGFFLVLSAAARCANFRDVFLTSTDGKIREIFYIDGDCYSRMTRVREILEGWGIVHYHPWENYPTGVYPHTTAPMDYLIVFIALLLKPFMKDYIDMAGAVVSPILGVMTTGFLALWARELNQQYRKLMLLVVALSPILVHGTTLGRPAHHSLQIFLLAVGIGAELIMVRNPCPSWSIASGIAWGLALWVSLYEPLVLIVVIFVTKLIFYRSNLFVKERRSGLIVFLGILVLAYLLEGKYLVKSFAIEMHVAQDPSARIYLSHWLDTIAEMNHQGVFSELLYRSVGFGLLAAPLLLIARIRDAKRSVLLLSLLVTTFIFSLEEERWTYFFALVYAMSLPWQLSLFKRKWIVYSLFFLSLWPVAREWEGILYPDAAHDELRAARVLDQARLRQAAEFIGQKAPGAILAPWWWSPQLVYWSGQPALAGSSHESLPGIVSTSQFFATAYPRVAQAVCDQNYVETVVTGNPENIVIESCHILGKPLPEQEDTMADVLWDKPHSAPVFLHLVWDDNVYKVFEVNHGYVVR